MNEAENAIYITDKKLVCNKAKRASKNGRASGGVAFIIGNKLNYDAKFYSERIATLCISNLVIINVHLTHYDGTYQNKVDFVTQLAQVQTLIEEHQQASRDVLILGDFNTDPIKLNHNTTELKKFLNKNMMILRDLYEPQSIDYTYKSKCHNRHATAVQSWIDHLMCHKALNDRVYNVQILTSTRNKSDHNCIAFKYRYSANAEKHVWRNEPIKKITINWTDMRIVNQYKEKVKNKINKISNLVKELETETVKERIKLKISIIINEISSLLINSAVKISNEIKNLKKNKRRKIGSLKFKRWWNSSIQEIHCELIKSYIEFRQSNFNLAKGKEYFELKRVFRLQKRYNIHLCRNKKLAQIDKLFKLDKNAFWKKIKLSEQKNTKINIPLDKLRDHYYDLFNKKKYARWISGCWK